VDGSEECDCLFRDCSDYPCCDAFNCKLFPNAACSAKVSECMYFQGNLFPR
jgi:hypothetical protein